MVKKWYYVWMYVRVCAGMWGVWVCGGMWVRVSLSVCVCMCVGSVCMRVCGCVQTHKRTKWGLGAVNCRESNLCVCMCGVCVCVGVLVVMCIQCVMWGVFWIKSECESWEWVIESEWEWEWEVIQRLHQRGRRVTTVSSEQTTILERMNWRI